MPIAKINKKVTSFKDIDLTFKANPITKDLPLKVDENAIKNSLRNLVLTKPFETPFHPEVSCQLYSALFDNVSPINSEIIRTSVIQVIDKFEPRVTLLGVTVEENNDNNSYILSIAYTIIGSQVPVSLTITLERVR